MTQTLLRHIAACNHHPSTAELVPFRIGEAPIGWMSAEAARVLTFEPREAHFDGDGVSLPARYRTPAARSDALARLARLLAERGFGRIRNELFDVRESAEGPSLATLDRGVVPAFGVIGQGVHVNGLVRRADGLHVWIGFRARDKAVAPGQIDNLVGGGITAGMDPESTLLKEADEEASLPEALAREARRTGRVSYMLSNHEGLRRDVLHCFDLDLPESFVPVPNDDEVERFELWPAPRLLEAVRHTDTVKFNVNLVLIDLFLREGLVVGEEAAALRASLQQGP